MFISQSTYSIYIQNSKIKTLVAIGTDDARKTLRKIFRTKSRMMNIEDIDEYRLQFNKLVIMCDEVLDKIKNGNIYDKMKKSFDESIKDYRELGIALFGEKIWFINE